jgi:hypothetical protein
MVHGVNSKNGAMRHERKEDREVHGTYEKGGEEERQLQAQIGTASAVGRVHKNG